MSLPSIGKCVRPRCVSYQRSIVYFNVCTFIFLKILLIQFFVISGLRWEPVCLLTNFASYITPITNSRDPHTTRLWSMSVLVTPMTLVGLLTDCESSLPSLHGSWTFLCRRLNFGRKRIYRRLLSGPHHKLKSFFVTKSRRPSVGNSRPLNSSLWSKFSRRPRSCEICLPDHFSTISDWN